MKKILSFLAFFFIFLSSVHAGTPVWTFTPLTATTIVAADNTTPIINYRVTNQSPKPHTLFFKSIPAITQLTAGAGLCDTAFTLAGQAASCILSLQVNVNQLAGSVLGGPVVCDQSNPNQCYQPAEANILNISKGSAAMSVAGSPLTLVINGANGNLTITNISSAPIYNITSNFSGTALQGNVTEVANTCSSLAPAASCSLSFAPGSSALALTNFPIQSNNASPIIAAIEVVPPLPSLISVNPSSGPLAGGNSVTLSGNNFLGANNVTFGGVGAVFSVVDTNTITATAPAHAAGAVNVDVTTPYGTATLPNAYTYQLPPSLGSISPVSGSTSGYTSFTLTGNNLLGITSVTFDGAAVISFNVVDANTITGVTPAHAAGLVNVVVSGPYGNSTLAAAYTYQNTAVGQAVGGGFIACLGSGFNDFIVNTVDNDSGITWGGSGVSTNAMDVANGASNTTAIVLALGNNGGSPYAAQICDNFEIDSQGNTPCQTGNTCYGDWFLPAENQLTCLYNNQASIPSGFSSSPYWTSTESSATQAYAREFTGGIQTTANKINVNVVRCVRAFTP